jgi:hypothetical protein
MEALQVQPAFVPPEGIKTTSVFGIQIDILLTGDQTNGACSRIVSMSSRAMAHRRMCIATRMRHFTCSTETLRFCVARAYP